MTQTGLIYYTCSGTTSQALESESVCTRLCGRADFIESLLDYVTMFGKSSPGCVDPAC